MRTNIYSHISTHTHKPSILPIPLPLLKIPRKFDLHYLGMLAIKKGAFGSPLTKVSKKKEKKGTIRVQNP